MNADAFQLSDTELRMLRELLEEERRELPMEIRHTDNIQFHEDLQQRLKTVDALLEKLVTQPAH